MISFVNNCTRCFNSCLDHIFSRNSNFNDIESCIVRCNITDHFATTIQFGCDGINGFNNSNFENFNTHTYNFDFNYLNNLIPSEDWLALLNSTDVNIDLNIFNNKIHELTIKFASPISKKNNKYHKLKN